MATVDVYVDGLNVTQYVQGGQVTHRLNRPATAEITFPSGSFTFSSKSRLRVDLNGTIDFNGTLEGESAIELDGQEDPDSIIAKVQAIDPLVYLDTRRAMDADGDYSYPSFMYDFTTGPQIIQAILNNTLIQIGLLPFSAGFFATGGANISGAATNFPMMISEVLVALTDTGECDVEMVPYDSGSSSMMGVLNAYNGNLGQNLTGSVHFDYQTGSFNCTAARVVVDKSGLANRIRYLLGPKQKTPSDPTALQHWDGSIDRTTTAHLPAKWLAIGEPARAQSELDYGIREDTVIIDAQGDSSRGITAANTYLPRELYYRRWTMEAWLRLKPKVMVNLTPQPGTLPTFKVGDKISVNLGPRMTAGLSGVLSGEQRVMEYTYTWDENGVVELGAPAGQAGAAAVTTTASADGLA